MGKNIGVSVVIPVYNVAPYLDRCVKSIVEQTYTNLEIILVDDGSTDQSGVLCQRWIEKDSRIIYIRRQNKGLGESRNIGIRASSFDLITFVDSDDWLESDFVGKVLCKMYEADADIGICDIFYVDSSDMHREISAIRLPETSVSAADNTRVLNRVRTFAWGKIYKKKLFIDHGIWFPTCVFEDIPCTPVLAALAQRVVRISEPLYNYFRNRSGSLANDAANIEDMERALALLYERLKDRKLLNTYALELKKLMIGQVRFAIRKWENLESDLICKKLEHLVKMIDSYFPGLFDVLSSKFYVYENDEFMIKALDRVVPRAQQIVRDIENADAMAFAMANSWEETDDIKTICIKRPASNDCSESVIWEVAEAIMEAL